MAQLPNVISSHWHLFCKEYSSTIHLQSQSLLNEKISSSQSWAWKHSAQSVHFYLLLQKLHNIFPSDWICCHGYSFTQSRVTFSFKQNQWKISFSLAPLVPIPVTSYTSFSCLNVPFSKNEEINMMSTSSGMETREAAVRLINRYKHWFIKQFCRLMKPSGNISYSLPFPCICKLAAIMKFSISNRRSFLDNWAVC